MNIKTLMRMSSYFLSTLPQLIKANQYSRSAYFIEKGMTRSYWLVNGEEITTSFSCEGGIVFSMDELYYNKMSEEFVETLEDVVA